MKKSLARRTGLFAAVLVLGACSGSDEPAAQEVREPTSITTAASTTTSPPELEPEVGDFPVEIDGVVITAEPERVVSLSPSATEMLFAIGAGDQMVAADSLSNFPPEAPAQDGLEAFTPNIEAIAAFEPDLLVTSFDPEDALVTAFGALGVPVLVQPGALSVDDTYDQIADHRSGS